MLYFFLGCTNSPYAPLERAREGYTTPLSTNSGNQGKYMLHQSGSVISTTNFREDLYSSTTTSASVRCWISFTPMWCCAMVALRPPGLIFQVSCLCVLRCHPKSICNMKNQRKRRLTREFINSQKEVIEEILGQI